MSELDPGTLIDGRYVVVSPLGSGGMADVYLAEDQQLGRRVAVKVLHSRFAQDPQFVERFRLEARAAAGLSHPNIVSIYDRGEFDGSYYIAMEYLPGRLLKDLVLESGPLDPEFAVAVVTGILEAAAFAHSHGIVHRDLKPHNVIVSADGRAQVTDFGIARAGISEMTQTGSVMGSAHYLSPEQAQGFVVDGSSDLYSIGVILFELLTGQLPFSGESPVAVALKHVTEEPPSAQSVNPAVSGPLAAVVKRALAKDPAERFEDAQQFIAALQAAANGEQLLPNHRPGVGDLSASRRLWQRLSGLRLTKRSAAVFGSILAVAALLAVATVKLWPEGTAQKAVPNVVGSDLATATAVLRNSGFDLTVQRVVNDAPKDRVLRQDPQPGVVSGVDRAVALSVSDGPANTAVPDLTGLSRAEAESRLRAAGLSFKVRRESSESVANGVVISSTPPSGVEVADGSVVTLIVSKGAKRVKLPNLVGKSSTAAQSQLSALGLIVDLSEVDSEAPDGTVLDQSPAADTRVKVGGTVKLLIARELLSDQDQQSVTMPNLVGDSLSSAVTALSALGLTVVTKEREVDNPSDDDTVLSQSQPEGKRLRKGSRVTITIGKLKS